MGNKLIAAIYQEVLQSQKFADSREVSEYTRQTGLIDEKIESILGEEIFLEIDNLLSKQMGYAEDFGFMTGFKCAMRLISECDITNTYI